MPLWKPFLGPFHSVLLHLPIGFLALTFVLDLYCARFPSAEGRRLTTLALRLTAIMAAVVATLGLWRASSGHYNAEVLRIHKWGGLGVVVLMALTAVAQQWAFAEQPRRATTWAYRGLFALTLGILMVTGHFGGSLAHGSRYLTKHAPDAVKKWLGVDNAPAVPTTQDSGVRLFLDDIQPILETKCIGCHGPDTQMGGYQLDRQAPAFRGGSGLTSAIVPGAPLQSDVVRRILLNPEHPDVMPPDGVERLTNDEKLAIVDWIQQGAPFVERQK